MAYAEFTDRAGKSWRVWHTLPRLANLLTALPQEWKDGWLTFESEGDKRRLAPFPAEWERLPASRLELLCRAAKPASETPLTQAALRREERRSR
jgi:hypothetical protein